MNIREIDGLVKKLVDYKGFGFYETKSDDRNITMIKEQGETTRVIFYEYYPKVGMNDLILNGGISYHIILPKINQILLTVYNSCNSQGFPKFDHHNVTLIDGNEVFQYRHKLWGEQKFQ